ncbi:hypothetical protein ACW2QC_07435 [Virgibacillus sp. FSP13]
MTDPYKDLVRTLEKRNKKNMQYVMLGVGSDLGTITSRMELKLDNFKHPINDYMISEHLTMNPDYFTKVEENTHGHRVITNKELKPLAPGDRVVVLLVNGGQEHVVVARVVAN